MAHHRSDTAIHIPELRDVDAKVFQQIIQPSRKPVLLKSVDIGSCTLKWTPEYLCAAVNPQKAVSVHESLNSRLRFSPKNFVYKVMSFLEFINEASRESFGKEKEYFYYRAVADDVRNVPSDFRRDFAELAPDFILPSFVAPETIFSCVFRCGSADLGMDSRVILNAWDFLERSGSRKHLGHHFCSPLPDFCLSQIFSLENEQILIKSSNNARLCRHLGNFCGCTK